MHNVIDKIRKCGICDYVIIDMESHIDAIGQEIFEQADHIVVVEKPGEVPDRKMEMFAQQALACEHRRKMCRIVNFAESAAKTGNQLPVPTIGSIRNYGNQSLKGIIQTVLTKDAIDISSIL